MLFAYNAICIISNSSARYATTVLQVL